MKLLIVTQIVDENDLDLGFFHRWIEEFAKHCERVEVICLKEGKHTLPENVRTYSLGKEKNVSRVKYILNFYKYIWRLRHGYDMVFVHMNPEYVILGGTFWRLWHKPIAFWYTHKSVNLRLRTAIFFANIIFSASSESMRAKTKKKRVVGHGIDVSSIPMTVPPQNDSPLQLLVIGRLSPVKRIDVLIDAVAILKDQGVNAILTIVGGAVDEQGQKYVRELHTRVREKELEKQIIFFGPVPRAKISEFFASTHLFVHASATGSLDKVSIEPLAAGVPVITTNKELGTSDCPGVMLVEPTPEAFAQAIKKAVSNKPWADTSVRNASREWLIRNHSLEALIPCLLREF